MAAPPRFTSWDKPRDIVDAAGRWLASELGSTWSWVPSSRTLRFSIAQGRTCQLRLRPSHWNYSGVLTHAEIQVAVRDRSLAKWRRARGKNSSGLVADTSSDVIWCVPMVNIDPDLDDVELFGDVAAATQIGRRTYLRLPDLLTAIKTRILPKLLLFASPARAASGLPDIWLAQPGPMVEWAISLEDRDSAELISTRSRKLKGELPPESELETVLAEGRRLLEALRVEMRHGSLASQAEIEVGLGMTGRLIRELSDPQGRTDLVKDGALANWATTRLPPDSPIRAGAIAFDDAAAQIRKQN